MINKIKILNSDYNIRLINEDSCNNVLTKGFYDGETDFQKEVITININNSGNKQVAILIHEMLHVIAEKANIEIGENTIVYLESSIHSVLKDNPHIFNVVSSLREPLGYDEEE